MAGKRTIKARAILKDLWQGMSNRELMEKHKLETDQLDKILEKLIDAGWLQIPEAPKRLYSRRFPRIPISFGFPVYDPKGSRMIGIVRDLSEGGLRIASRRHDLGLARAFLIRPERFAGVKAFQFVAHCRWLKERGAVKKHYIAGFEITGISEEALQELRKLIDVLSGPGSRFGTERGR